MFPHYYNSEKTDEAKRLGNDIFQLTEKSIKNNQDIVIMCIGSDRSTGDALGPLTGYELLKKYKGSINVFGTVYNPINAINLPSAYKMINKLYSDPFIIAIDSCLGIKEHVGLIALKKGPLLPGLGVKNKLPAVGNINITGIVNTYGNNNCHLLQTTRLYTVITMADMIANAFDYSFNYNNHDEKECILA